MSDNAVSVGSLRNRSALVANSVLKLLRRDVGSVRFPHLSFMAVDFLTIASSSAETERDFSSCGRMITPLRCRLR